MKLAVMDPANRDGELVVPSGGLAIADRGESGLKPFLDNFGIYRRQGVLGRQISLRPNGRLIRRTDSHQFLEQALPKHCRLFGRTNGSCTAVLPTVIASILGLIVRCTSC